MSADHAVGRSKSSLPDIACEVPECASVVVVVVRLFLELGEHAVRVFVRPVGQHDDVVTVAAEGLWCAGLDDERAVQPALFLEPRVAVIPVGPRLPDNKPIRVRLTRVECR